MSFIVNLLQRVVTSDLTACALARHIHSVRRVKRFDSSRSESAINCVGEVTKTLVGINLKSF